MNDASRTTKCKNDGIAVGTLNELLQLNMTPQQRARARKCAEVILNRMNQDAHRRQDLKGN